MSELNVPPLVLTGLPPARKTKRLDDAVLGWQTDPATALPRGGRHCDVDSRGRRPARRVQGPGVRSVEDVRQLLSSTARVRGGRGNRTLPGRLSSDPDTCLHGIQVDIGAQAGSFPGGEQR